MPAIGINLTLKIGAQKPEPAPRLFMEALQSVEVTHSDEGRSGFQLVFQVGRAGRPDRRDYQLLKNPLLAPFNRVILIVTNSATAQVLMDGVITNQQLSPSLEPGQSTLTITGEDVSVMMDLSEKSVEHPQQNPQIIVENLIADYKSPYGLKAEVKDPYRVNRPGKNERIPVQQGTDLNYIKSLAQRYGYIFYVKPGAKATTNIAYWGPRQQGNRDRVQSPLTVNMGSYTNVESLNFQHNALAATTVKGQIQDRKTNRIQPLDISSRSADARPQLARRSPLKTGTSSQSQLRLTQFRHSGLTMDQAQDRAQGTVDRSTDDVVNISGELDTAYYGGILQVRELVGLRGVGFNYDGLYYVKKVTHKIRVRTNEYKQSFSLIREGLESTKERLEL